MVQIRGICRLHGADTGLADLPSVGAELDALMSQEPR
jgi:hypothetical protein